MTLLAKLLNNMPTPRPMTSEDIIKVLSLTIKEDNDNKLVAFLCMLLAYTRSSQFNVSFNAPSATGKSFIPTEVAKLFPQENVMEIGYTSPTAFFHDVGEFDKTAGGYIVNFSNKILIFLDQPHNQLLERLRPILSHDKYETQVKITDRHEKHGIRTKNVFMRGFPVVVFATAGLRLDEQEATRFFLLSPEVTQHKLRQAIKNKVRREADSLAYGSKVDTDAERVALKERIDAIKAAKIDDVILPNPEIIESRFFADHKTLKPRHQRDINRLLCLIKAFALLNLWHREQIGNRIIACQEDIDEAFILWGKISVSQDHNIPPYVYNLYLDIILPLWERRVTETGGNTKDKGLSRQDITKGHFSSYGRNLDPNALREQILPMLETAGLINIETSSQDRRQKLVYPTMPASIVADQNNNTEGDGVNNAYIAPASKSLADMSPEEIAEIIPF